VLLRCAPWIAQNEFSLSWLHGVLFILSSNFPWVFAASLAAIPFLWAARKIGLGSWSAKTPLDLPLALFGILGVVGAAISVGPSVSCMAHSVLDAVFVRTKAVVVIWVLLGTITAKAKGVTCEC
jgi:hypothetical protein